MEASRSCGVTDGLFGWPCAREAGHNGLHDCGYSFKGGEQVEDRDEATGLGASGQADNAGDSKPETSESTPAPEQGDPGDETDSGR